MLFLSILFYYSAILATISINACLLASINSAVVIQSLKHARNELHCEAKKLHPSIFAITLSNRIVFG